jgi:protein-tyrosine-phosphatase
MAAARRGVDLAPHRSHLLTADTVRRADLIVVMDPAQARAIRDRFARPLRDIVVLGDLDPAPLAARTIQDPVDQPLEMFEQSYARIERCVAELVRVLDVGPLVGYEPQAEQRLRAQGDGRRPDRR